jgi:drug/metabolite transporter (DMT)-like permease
VPPLTFPAVRLSALDFGLLLMVIIWGANFSAIKYALREFSPVIFNAFRLLLAALVFLVAIAITRPRAGWSQNPRERRLSRDEWIRIAALGVIGHLWYQLLFLAGLARTTASNGALIFGATPIAVAILSSLTGHERVRRAHWVGAALSFVGIYAIFGAGATLSGGTIAGDALVFCGMLCWSIYSVVSQPLLERHSPLVVTGYSLAIGAALYLLVALPSMGTTNWEAISTTSWVLMALSSLLALAFAYIVWYTAVQRIGSARTAIYSNLTPIVAMIVAAVWLDEAIGARQMLGAATILGGVFITRFAPAAPSQEA